MKNGGCGKNVGADAHIGPLFRHMPHPERANAVRPYGAGEDGGRTQFAPTRGTEEGTRVRLLSDG